MKEGSVEGENVVKGRETGTADRSECEMVMTAREKDDFTLIDDGDDAAVKTFMEINFAVQCMEATNTVVEINKKMTPSSTT